MFLMQKGGEYQLLSSLTSNKNKLTGDFYSSREKEEEEETLPE